LETGGRFKINRLLGSLQPAPDAISRPFLEFHEVAGMDVPAAKRRRTINFLAAQPRTRTALAKAMARLFNMGAFAMRDALPHLLINSLPAWMYKPQSGVVQSISLQHSPAGADDGCMNF
jgi:hypothetical protein